MKILLNWRYYILLLLWLKSLFYIFAEPVPDTENWFIALMLSKIAGFGCLWLTLKIMLYWKARGDIPELARLLDD